MASAFIHTVKERCRMCYTCVRECPAKAIRIVEGQAEVIGIRCVACGNCVRVCSQHAKQVVSSLDAATALLASGRRTAICVAPSFPAEFTELQPKVMVGMLRALGFAYAHEVAFGADLVARRYAAMLASSRGGRYIATTCPAVVGFVERYYPALVEALAPVVSPMVATARVIRKLHGADTAVVFVGPCIAKKVEAADEQVAGEIDVALTFVELRVLFDDRGITADSVMESDFDPPHGGAGSLFAISGGMLQAAGIREDLLRDDVVAAQGREGFLEALREFDAGNLDARLLECLCCQGCIMGAGVSRDTPSFSRRAAVSAYARRRVAALDRHAWLQQVRSYDSLDLSRRYRTNDQRVPSPRRDEIADILARMGKLSADDELNCGACGYDTCQEHAVAIHKGLAESEMCLPFTIDQLRKVVRDLAESNRELANTQEALMHSEKLASMGQLAAGIAHEVNNPLGVVLMYAHMLFEECDRQSAMRQDLALIAEQADRCKKIVAGLLDFARQNKVVRTDTDIVELVQSVLRTAGIPANVRARVEGRPADPVAGIDRDQIVQVLANLVTNSIAAMPEGGELTVRLSDDPKWVQFEVIDTGTGIAPANLPKIFEPFFTTKQMGKGTGLGLAVTYGIVKMHSGDIKVTSNADPAAGPTGTTFTVRLPRARAEE